MVWNGEGRRSFSPRSASSDSTLPETCSDSAHAHAQTHPCIILVGVRAWLARGYFIPGGASQRGGGQAAAFRVARCRTRPLIDIRLGPVRARRGPVWVRILVVHRYRSIESSVRARRGPSGHIGQIRGSVGFPSDPRFGTTGPDKVPRIT